MLSQNINLTTNKKPVTPVVHMVQNDSGRKLVCTVYDYTSVTSGALSVELPSGTVYTATGTISSSTDHITLSCDITNSMLAEVGKVKATVKLFNASSQLVSAHMLYIDVEESAGFNHPITPQNDKIYVVIDGQNIELAKQPQVDTLQTDVTNLKEDLRGISETSENLFVTKSNVQNFYFTKDITHFESPNAPNEELLVYIACEPNTTYIINHKKSSRFAVGYSTNIPSRGLNVYGIIQNNDATSLKLTTGADARYVCAWVWQKSSDTDDKNTILNSVTIKEVYAKDVFARKQIKNISVIPIWNVAQGGIAIKGKNIHINKNGFGLILNDTHYYIAPIDRSTEYDFEAVGTVCALMIDTTKLISESRANPDDVIILQDVAASAIIPKDRIVVAMWYKDHWDFCGNFRYFNDKPRTRTINPYITSFQLCSHRGDSSKRNNTIEAFESAYNLGYKVVECDLRFTSDSFCVLFHDEGIGGKAISQYTLNELQTAYNYIPTLTEMLMWAKKRGCVIELDCAGRVTESQINYVYDKCKAVGMLNAVIFTGYESELKHLYNNGKVDTNVCVSFLSGVPSESSIGNISPVIKEFNYSMVSINKVYLTEALVNYAHGEGFGAQTWTITSESEAKELFYTTVDLILCDASSHWDV